MFSKGLNHKEKEMASGFAPWWKRYFLYKTPLYKKGPICGNYHWFRARYCYCCIGMHYGNWHGGIYDFKSRKEIRKYWQCDSCWNIEFYEREIMCWACGKGEMIYLGPDFEVPNGKVI